MIERTLEQIAAMADGELTVPSAGSIRIEGVSTDSRTVQPGNLFVPLVGDLFDGHDYVIPSLDRGAAASFWERGRPIPEGNRPLILVDDTLSAYQRLAASYRRELPVRIIGITGSNGKTTTKDITASVMARSFTVLKTEGNLNNHIGLPKTLLLLKEETQVAVVEMGMSGFGEIELLSRIAQPDIAIITNIGESHLQQLGTRAGIAKAKTEILSGLKEDGLFLYNGDEPLIEEALKSAPQPEHMTTIRFGLGTDNDIHPVSLSLGESGMRFSVHSVDSAASWEEIEFMLPLLGKHNVSNALAAIAAGRYLGMTDSEIAEGLAAVQMTGMRIERVRAANGAVLLNDAYNASPTSMRAAIVLLTELEGYSRRIAVLGDMLELGDQEVEFHREIGRLVQDSRIDRVFVYGPLGHLLAEEAASARPEGTVNWQENKTELIRILKDEVRPDDAVLFKASRGMKLEEVVHALQ